MRTFIAVLLCLVLVAPAAAHFAYIVPTSDKSSLQVVFADSLKPDTKVPIDKIAATKLFALGASETVMPVEFTKAEHSLMIKLPAGSRVIGGVTDYGFHQSKHTQNIPVLLMYYPKAIVGPSTGAEQGRLGDRVPLEIVPMLNGGSLTFQAIYQGKPLAGAEFGVLAPGDEASSQKLSAGDDGVINARFQTPGQYGVRVAYFEKKPGELDSKKYDEVRHYATLVLDFQPASAGK